MGIIDKCGVRGDATLCVVIFCVVTLIFLNFQWVYGFYHRTKSDLFLFLFISDCL